MSATVMRLGSACKAHAGQDESAGKTGPRHPRDWGAIIDALWASREDCDAVPELTRRLVRVPRRGGMDPYGPVLECMSAWLGEHGLACRRVAGPGGAPVALTRTPCGVHASYKLD
jgi:hypothetical protein